MNVSTRAFDEAFFRFSLDYPRSFPTADAVTGQRALWREMLEDHPWIDDAVFRAAVKTAGYTIAGYLPDRPLFLELCRDENRRRHDQQQQLQHAFPETRPVRAASTAQIVATFKAAQDKAGRQQ